MWRYEDQAVSPCHIGILEKTQTAHSLTMQVVVLFLSKYQGDARHFIGTVHYSLFVQGIGKASGKG